MHKVVVASDSFKGCLSSWQVADAVEKGIHDALPGCDVVKRAVADGGEGSMEALMTTLGGESVELMVSDPLGRPVEAEYAWMDPVKTTQRFQCSLLALNWSLCIEKRIRQAQDAGIHVSAWTVNDPALMRQLAQYGVDSLITDFPGLASTTLENR